jgi:hypothetical protein
MPKNMPKNCLLALFFLPLLAAAQSLPTVGHWYVTEVAYDAATDTVVGAHQPVVMVVLKGTATDVVYAAFDYPSLHMPMQRLGSNAVKMATNLWLCQYHEGAYYFTREIKTPHTHLTIIQCWSRLSASDYAYLYQ